MDEGGRLQRVPPAIGVLASTPSDGSQAVTVPAGWATPTARIRITWLRNGTIVDVGQQNFVIQ